MNPSSPFEAEARHTARAFHTNLLGIVAGLPSPPVALTARILHTVGAIVTRPDQLGMPECARLSWSPSELPPGEAGALAIEWGTVPTKDLGIGGMLTKASIVQGQARVADALRDERRNLQPLRWGPPSQSALIKFARSALGTLDELPVAATRFAAVVDAFTSVLGLRLVRDGVAVLDFDGNQIGKSLSAGDLGNLTPEALTMRCDASLRTLLADRAFVLALAQINGDDDHGLDGNGSSQRKNLARSSKDAIERGPVKPALDVKSRAGEHAEAARLAAQRGASMPDESWDKVWADLLSKQNYLRYQFARTQLPRNKDKTALDHFQRGARALWKRGNREKVEAWLGLFIDKLPPLATGVAVAEEFARFAEGEWQEHVRKNTELGRYVGASRDFWMSRTVAARRKADMAQRKAVTARFDIPEATSHDQMGK